MVSHRGRSLACPGQPLTCSLADDFGDRGGKVPNPIGAFLSIMDVPLPSPIRMLLQDLPRGQEGRGWYLGLGRAGGQGAGSSLTVMTSPARTLRAVGSWRFQKSFNARTFRIPDASEGNGQREEGTRAQGKRERFGEDGGRKQEGRGEDKINTAGRTRSLDIGGKPDGTGMLMLAARLV